MENNVLGQWDDAAKAYSLHQQASFDGQFERRILRQLLPDLNGQTVLDAGCGDGGSSAMLQQLGAEVRGCDGSSKMVELCRQNHPDIPFELADLCAALPYADYLFDFILCNLVLMDIDPINPFFAEAQRVLKPGGRLLVSIVHPAFFTGDWEVDAQGQKQAKKVYDYLNPHTETLDFWGPTTHYHRPISTYINTAAQNNLCLEQMVEPSPRKEDLPPYKFHLARIPLYLYFLFKRFS